jgi:eukaryotic-like serine/threonine-protein kinase
VHYGGGTIDDGEVGQREHVESRRVVRGTPAFIAPEPALGGRPVDHRADIYGTGCLTYWLLTGQLVFTGGTPMQLLIQHAQALPEPPSARTDLPIPKELDAECQLVAKEGGAQRWPEQGEQLR